MRFFGLVGAGQKWLLGSGAGVPEARHQTDFFGIADDVHVQQLLEKLLLRGAGEWTLFQLLAQLTHSFAFMTWRINDGSST